MQMQWKTIPCRYLRSGLCQVQNQEQTLELRLSEGMGDIGRVLCAWGQPVLREKQWRSEEISVSGGIQAYVLYIPEDGSPMRCVEGWIPFQGKWKLPQDNSEGKMITELKLRNIDARAVSPRKLLVRASLAMMAQTWMPEQVAISQPDDVPDDVHLLNRTYPVCLAAEAGEQLISMDETIALPSQPMEKILCCRVEPQVTEQAVAGSRVVIRGILRAQYVYLDAGGGLASATEELPFAQFAQLQEEYDKETTANVCVMVSGLQWDMVGDGLHLKCDLVAQYVIYKRCMLQVTQDAYSPHRQIVPNMTQMELSVMLDRMQESVEASVETQLDIERVVDVAFLPDFAVHYREENMLQAELPAAFQMLYYDKENALQCVIQPWNGHWQMAANNNCSALIGVAVCAEPNALPFGDRIRLQCELCLDVQTGAIQQIDMLTGLEIGEQVPADPERPSVILRKSGGLGLWELAKTCGSTVAAIEQANGLNGEPDDERMLLIPVV